MDTTTAAHNGLYQQTLEQTLAGAPELIAQVLEATRLSLRTREDQARTAGEHQALREAGQQLMRLSPVMSQRYPQALRSCIEQDGTHQRRGTRALSSVQFDDLELMDEGQVNDSVERARAQQILASSVEGPLADLDGLISAAQGLGAVQAASNPLRPEMFLQALQQVLAQMQTSAQVRHEWISHMAQALGTQLRQLYLQCTDQLRRSGVQPVGFAMRQAGGDYAYVPPASGGASPGFESAPAQASPQAEASLLTLGRLRSLLLGELSPSASAKTAPTQPPTAASHPSTQQAFAERFAREFENPAALPALEAPQTDFAITVPAAFEALQEMKQVEHMVQRLEQQHSDGSNTQYAALAQDPKALGQALGMEVVALMLDNLARDGRLLWPVQQFLRTLEPALLQLAVVDPRFFSHKEHPARRLLQEITDRSLAYPHTKAPGFEDFMQTLLHIAESLNSADIRSQTPFAQALEQLQARWAHNEKTRERERQRAIAALEQAEQRQQLATDLSREIWLLPQIEKTPGEITRFLLGPWVQVMAHARLNAPDGGPSQHRNDPHRYRETVDALLWSADLQQTRANPAQLARLVPKLLAKLREGLACIDYPLAETKTFFDCLMQLHQEAFRPASAQPAPAPAPEPDPIPEAAPTTTRSALELELEQDDHLWIAPAEAKDSGFMDETTLDAIAASAPITGVAQAPQLSVGTWVNLFVRGQWERMQLSWIGPHDTLFLFTGAGGRTQSMTLRLLQRLQEQGALQVLTAQNVLDGALDAVARKAMRNSVDSQL